MTTPEQLKTIESTIQKIKQDLHSVPWMRNFDSMFSRLSIEQKIDKRVLQLMTAFFPSSLPRRFTIYVVKTQSKDPNFSFTYEITIYSRSRSKKEPQYTVTTNIDVEPFTINIQECE